MTTTIRAHDHKPLWRGPGLAPICCCRDHFGEPLRPHSLPTPRLVNGVAR